MTWSAFDASDAAYTIHGLLIADMAAQGVTRVRGISNHPATMDDFHGLMYQPRLRVLSMELKILSHRSVPR